LGENTTKYMENNKENKIAVLIDADNAQAEYIKDILAEVGKHGKITIKRIYGDWTDNRMNAWKIKINTYSLRPVQKFSLAKGKNSTDTAMIIEAMDILHSKNVTAFCIISSDSDYTGLAQRIREEGIFVMGVGEANKTAEAFVNSCDVFVFTENLLNNNSVNKDGKTTTENVEKAKKVKKLDLPLNKITNEPIDVNNILKAFDMIVDEEGLASMSEMGIALRKLDPSFDSRTYGSANLKNLFKRLLNLFEFVDKKGGSGLYIKLK